MYSWVTLHKDCAKREDESLGDCYSGQGIKKSFDFLFCCCCCAGRACAAATWTAACTTTTESMMMMRSWVPMYAWSCRYSSSCPNTTRWMELLAVTRVHVLKGKLVCRVCYLRSAVKESGQCVSWLHCCCYGWGYRQHSYWCYNCKYWCCCFIDHQFD